MSEIKPGIDKFANMTQLNSTLQSLNPQLLFQCDSVAVAVAAVAVVAVAVAAAVAVAVAVAVAAAAAAAVAAVVVAVAVVVVACCCCCCCLFVYCLFVCLFRWLVGWLVVVVYFILGGGGRGVGEGCWNFCSAYLMNTKLKLLCFQSISNSEPSSDLNRRIRNLNDHFTYRYVSMKDEIASFEAQAQSLPLNLSFSI